MPEVGIHVRAATGDDAEAISAIGSAGFQATHEAAVGAEAVGAVVEQTYAPDAVRRAIAACAADDAAHFLVAEHHGRVVGFVHYDAAGPEPELHRIYIDPALKRSGVGSALLAELHRRLPSGLSYILMVLAANESAIAFYSRHGFTVERVVDGIDFYRDHMGVAFPPDTQPATSLVMRHTVAATGAPSKD